MCCSQKRGAMNVNAGSPNSTVSFRDSGQTLMRVCGTATGCVCQFSPVQPVQAVDPQVAQALLASGDSRVSR
jgi:hypothetical protein